MRGTMRSEGGVPAMLSVELAPTSEAPAAARAAIVDFCQDREIASSPLATLMLLVSEVVTNAVVHPDAGPGARILLAARVDDHRVRVEVTDQGGGFVPRPRAPSGAAGGFGLYLLEKESHAWGVLQGRGTCVWFEIAV